MEFDSYGSPESSRPPVSLPVADVWTSSLWADPNTVGGFWTQDQPAQSATEAAPLAAPIPRPSAAKKVAFAVGVFALALVLGFGIVKALPGSDRTSAAAAPAATAPAIAPPQPPTPRPTTSPSRVPGASGSAQAAAVSPSLANIETTVGYDGSAAAGTGVVLTADGIVLTNHHVLAGATSISVTVIGNGKTYKADVVGYDASHDIGVIKLRDASGLTPAPIGDSATVKIGDQIVGLGNAGGAGGQPIEASGSVTDLNQSITALDAATGTSERLTGLIQIDANVAPGDSGGAIVNTDNQIVGIITAGSVTPTGKATTTEGFAIPINQAMDIAQNIRDGKASSTIHIGASAFLGVQVSPNSGSTSKGQGVRISGVVAGSAAEKARLVAGDTITAIDGTTVTTNTKLRALIATHQSGDTVTLTWLDSQGAEHTASLTFGQGPVG